VRLNLILLPGCVDFLLALLNKVSSVLVKWNAMPFDGAEFDELVCV